MTAKKIFICSVTLCSMVLIGVGCAGMTKVEETQKEDQQKNQSGKNVTKRIESGEPGGILTIFKNEDDELDKKITEGGTDNTWNYEIKSDRETGGTVVELKNDFGKPVSVYVDQFEDDGFSAKLKPGESAFVKTYEKSFNVFLDTEGFGSRFDVRIVS